MVYLRWEIGQELIVVSILFNFSRAVRALIKDFMQLALKWPAHKKRRISFKGNPKDLPRRTNLYLILFVISFFFIISEQSRPSHEETTDHMAGVNQWHGGHPKRSRDPNSKHYFFRATPRPIINVLLLTAAICKKEQSLR